MATLKQAELLLNEINGDRVWPWCFGDFGRDRNDRGRSIIVAQNRARDLLTALRERLPDGLVAWIGTSRWLGEGMENLKGYVELAAALGTSQLDILSHAGAGEGVISQVKAWDAAFGLVIDGAQSDELSFRLLGKPADMTVFLAEVGELWPLVNPQLITESIERNGSVELAWD